MRRDDGGMFWDTVFDVVSLVCSVVDVIKNPDDPWAWAGLAADVVSLAVPFATGGGTIVKAASKVDDVVDVAKTVGKAGNIIEAAADAGRATDKIVDGVKIRKATEFTKEAQNLIDSLDHADGITKSTADIGKKIHKGYKTGYDGIPGMFKEYRHGKYRFDFLDDNNKIIYELKPNNPRSIRQGIKQLKRYNEALGGGYTLILEWY